VSQVYQIEKLVDDQKLGAFNLKLLLLCFLAMFGDGFDISALASAAPELRREWNVAAQDFAISLSASQFGVLFGAPLLGYFGDRYGRRVAIITGCLIFGVGTLATVWATNLDQMTVLRFITGIGIGGLMPNTIALNSELSPRRWRATLVVLMFTGITAGSGLPGNIQAWLIPEHGWQIMFWIGGIVPIVTAVLLWFTLPESVKYLALHPEKRRELLATVRKLRPDLQFAEDAQFVSAPAPAATGSGLAQLYGPGMRLITPLLWICFATALMANFFLNSWLPMIFENSGLTPQEAGTATSLYHYGGTIGGVLVSLLLARFGFSVIAVLFMLAAPAIAALGLPGASYAMLATFSTLAGFFVLGAQFGNNATSGLIYPTAFRSRGVGWALGVGRISSITGPLLGGFLIAMALPLDELFRIAAIPMAIGFLAALGLVWRCYLRFGSLQIDDMPASAEPPAGTAAPARASSPS
jgi:AAHS family 4-hydroxybenzoate transporter-like MFS transporter